MQYPKMLYKGDQENYQTVIAYKEDHEAELIADGWADIYFFGTFNLTDFMRGCCFDFGIFFLTIFYFMG